MMHSDDPRDNGNGPTIMALEIEDFEDEEQDSLIRETMDMDDGAAKDKTIFAGRNAHGMRHRSTDHSSNGANGIVGSSLDRGTAYIRGFLRSDLMSHAAYHLRNFLILGLLAFLVLSVMEFEGEEIRDESMEATRTKDPHGYTFGGKNNVGHSEGQQKPKKPLHPGGAANLTPEELHQQVLEEEAYFIGPWDLSVQNDLNENGHFLHDPIFSPFASKNYAEKQEELDRRQALFTEKMQKITDEFGVWNNPNPDGEAFNINFYDYYDYRDVPIDDFPEYVWQKDKDYIETFLAEASALVEAVKEGIMQEYNHINPDDLEKDLFGVILDDHVVVDGQAVHMDTAEKKAGIAYLPQTGWDGLVKKMLHAMVTTDYFYVVCVGKGDTYQANNFWQSQVMQFNHLMEPVFHKLGMTLISRNMGIDASTAFSALGGADIYGETDILWHFQQHDAEEKPGEYDLLQKQTILAGERVPLIISPVSEELVQASKGKAWVGNLQPGADMCEKTTLHALPEAPACHNVRCDSESEDQCNVYQSVCWVPRSDWNPPEESQDKDAGNQDKRFPGYRQHQLEGRKMSLMILHALGAALKLWGEQIQDAGYEDLPLAEEYWHVGDSYKQIRTAMMDLTRAPGESAAAPSCELLMRDIDPRICNLPMHAYTEWTPRVMPRTLRLEQIVDNVIDGYGESEEADAYDEPDLLPIEWQIPAKQIDVHMIAIAANKTYDYDDDIFLEEVWGDDDLFFEDGFGRYLVRNEEGSKEHRVLRKLQNGEAAASGEISPGAGWRLVGAPIGFCDGSAQSRCNRHVSNHCLLANHNHYQASLAGKPKNGWLVGTIPDLRHGIILARLEFIPSSGSAMPNDLVLEYAINGEITSVKGSELKSFGTEIVNNLKVYPLLLDNNYADFDLFPDGRHCEVALRIQSSSDPECEVQISHIYFA